ncbi:MAG: LysR family transcriptional regulator [Myxococcales bacterium]|nr:LysR family transcriptional regulator [Myxococcales bacterium]
MDLDNLRCFAAGARHLSFRRAARQVHLSPAAYSDRISRLEAALGTRLFERTTRHVALTPAGERLLPAAQRILANVDDLPALVKDDGLPPPVTLTLGTRHELGLSWLLPSIEAIAAPHRTVHLRFSDSHALLEALKAGTLDAVLTSFRLTAPGLAYATLFEEQYVFVGQPALLAAQPLAGPSNSTAHTLLDAHGDLPLFRYFLDACQGPQAWSFGHTRWVGTIAAIRQLVVAGKGVAVLPRYYAQPDIDAGHLQVIMPDTEPVIDWFRLVWRRDSGRAPALVELANELRVFPLA